MIRRLRPSAAGLVNHRPSGRSNGRLFAAVGLALAAFAPAGPLPLPTPPGTPSVPGLPSSDTPITSGVTLTAVDEAGRPLVNALFEVFRAEAPEGVQTPFVTVPTTSDSGSVTVPLPEPANIPDAASNYYAVSSGLTEDGAEVTGIDFFNLTALHPMATATISPNLVQIPGVRIQTGSPSPSGPCGFRPDADNPPPPYFTISKDNLGVQDGTINVGAAHGAGSWSGSSVRPSDILGSNVRALGEELASTGSRTTESSVVMALDTHGETQSKYQITGNLHFTLASGDIAEFASRTDRADQAGFGARNLVVAATWLHEALRFHCNDGSFDEVYEVWTPHEWNPHLLPTKPAGFAYWDTREGLENMDVAVVTPYWSGQNETYDAGDSQVYSNGYGGEISAGPAGANFSVESQTTYTVTHEVTIYSGNDCGSPEAPECYYWQMNAVGASDGDCPWQMACGSDYYTGVLSTSPTIPGPEPQPCSKYAPHHAGDC